MQYDRHVVTRPWTDYELLDSGEGMKLERWGEVITARPETQALWAKRHPEQWRDAHATFASDAGKGAWKKAPEAPDGWQMAWEDARIELRLTSFKHTGLFPEQAPNWSWSKERIAALGSEPSILNLFGYTGASTLVSASGGASMTHLDASSPAIQWAKENQKISGMEKVPIRWILDDALKFVKREARRGVKYDAIILDPPVFGRGPKGEIWKIKENLVPLLYACKEVLSGMPVFIIITTYGLGESSILLKNLIADIVKGGALENGEFCLKPKFGKNILPLSSFCLWKNLV